MLKKMGMGLLLFLILFIDGISEVNAKLKYADGSATVKVIAKTNIRETETFKVMVRISDVVGEDIVGVGGQIIYDADYLEFVSMEGVNNPFPIMVNSENQMFSGFALTNEGIKRESEVLTIVFKAVKEGETTISFQDLELSDAKTLIIKPDKLNVEEKKISIKKKQEEKETTKSSQTGNTSSSVSSDTKSEDITSKKVDAKVLEENNGLKEVVEEKISVNEILPSKETETVKDIKKTRQVNSMTNILEEIRSIFLGGRNKDISNTETKFKVNFKKVFNILIKNEGL